MRRRGIGALFLAGLVLAGTLGAAPGFAADDTGGAAGDEAPAAAHVPTGESAAAPEAAPAEDGDQGEQFDKELLTIEEQVHSLKEQVFRSKATLQLLKEIVVQASSAGSRATIWHVNKLGRGYTIESVAYYLDGQGKFSKADPKGGLDEMDEFKVFEGALPPGQHNLTVNMQLRGNGFGIFSYVKDYTFNVQASTAFNAEEGKSCTVRVVADERKGIGRSFVERPNVRFETQCIRLTDSESAE